MEPQVQPTEDAGLSTKERLLLTAVEVFAAKGFQGATVREICQAAGTNVAAVNYHFGDKERLYEAVLWRIFEEHYDRSGRSEDDPSRPPQERLAAYIRSAIRNVYHKDEPCKGEPFAIFLMEMAHPSPYLADIVEHFIRPDYERTLSILRDYLGPDVPQPMLERCSDSIWGQILDHVFTWPIDRHLNPERNHPIENPDELAEHITTITLGGLDALKAQWETQRKQS